MRIPSVPFGPSVSPFQVSNMFPSQPFRAGQPAFGRLVPFALEVANADQVDLVLLNPPSTIQKPIETLAELSTYRQSLINRIKEQLPLQNLGRDVFAGIFNIPDNSPLYLFQVRRGQSKFLVADPTAKFQPEDVFGPSQYVPEVAEFDSTIPSARPAKMNQTTPLDKLMICEVHIGTLTKEGTFEAAKSKLQAIKDAGFNAVEVMPVHEFPGRWGWGYDPIHFFAPENHYGTPKQLMDFIDEAHRQGLNVILDVVYNHIGPQAEGGQIFNQLNPAFVGTETPLGWGKMFNYHHAFVQQFIFDNMKMWLDTYKVDGFRMDAAHIVEPSFLKRLARDLSHVDPNAILLTEHYDQSAMTTADDGLGFDSQLDMTFSYFLRKIAFHHLERHEANLTGLLQNIQIGPKAKDERQVANLNEAIRTFENHDTVANEVIFKGESNQYYLGQRARNIFVDKEKNLPPGYTGEDTFIAYSLLKYLLPGIPMAFMGEQYGETKPFRYFADYVSEREKRSRVGERNKEILNKAGIFNKLFQPSHIFSNKAYTDCKVSWKETPRILALHKAITTLRLKEPALRSGSVEKMNALQSGVNGVLALLRTPPNGDGNDLVVVANLTGHDYSSQYDLYFPPGTWQACFDSNDPQYGEVKDKPVIDRSQPIHSNGEQWNNIHLPPYTLLVFKKH